MRAEIRFTGGSDDPGACADGIRVAPCVTPEPSGHRAGHHRPRRRQSSKAEGYRPKATGLPAQQCSQFAGRSSAEHNSAEHNAAAHIRSAPSSASSSASLSAAYPGTAPLHAGRPVSQCPARVAPIWLASAQLADTWMHPGRSVLVLPVVVASNPQARWLHGEATSRATAHVDHPGASRPAPLRLRASAENSARCRR
ncbi:MAG: hypothetical protein K0R27_4737 [Xanthobacteraceae bacterium]|nr:hypothetical protein [Xanthobacteraceae bacterium]